MSARLSLASSSSNEAGRPSQEDQSNRLANLLLELARCVNPELAKEVPSRLEADPRLEAMRGVLIERERVALERLQRKFDDPREFADAVGAVLPAAFAIAAQDIRLGQAVAPTVERATQASIRKNPRTMVDILYPVMGPAIRKAIAQTLDGTLQSLNQAIKYSVSWRGLKWRIEAWRTGSTFADVVLRHTAVYQVDHLFLIHRKTGLLIAHVARDDASTQDPQMVSAMLSAIQDFVRDSFDSERGAHDDGAGIDSLRLGELLLWCEEGPTAFLAAVIHGNPPPALRTQLLETLAAVHEQWRAPLEDFNGDPQALQGIDAQLRPCLVAQTSQKHRRYTPLMWLLPLLLLAALGWWIGQRVMEHRRVNAYLAALQEQPGILVTAAERRDGKWVVAGLRDPLAVQPDELLARAKVDPGHITNRWEPYQALHPAIMLKRLQATLNPPASVTLTQEAGGIRATGSAPQYWMDKARAYLITLPAGAPWVDLSALKDVQDPDYVRLHDAIQSHIIYFENNVARPAPGQERTLDAAAAQMRELLQVARTLGFPVKVTIVGHADATGKENSNLALSLGRAEVVRSMMRQRGVDPTLLAVRGAGPLEPLKPGASEAELQANRRASFMVTTGE